MRLVLAVVLAVLVGGCGEGRTKLAGGKPVSYWVGALDSPDPGVRKTAVFKLGNVGASAFPALVGALRDEDAGVRREAIIAVLKCGPAAKAAATTLGDLREHDADSQVRTYAAKAFEKLHDGR
jgi:HEAT repeat protein